MSGAGRAALGFGIFFAALFSGLGVYLPFWPVWLEHRGMSSERIGLLVALPLVARSVASPLLAHFIDRTGRRRSAIGALSIGALLIFAAYGTATSFGALLVIGVGFGFCFSSLPPLADDLALRTAKARAIDYGRVRLWGSVAFVIMAIGAGEALRGRSPDILYALGLASIGSCAAAACLLPNATDDRAADAAGGSSTPWRWRTFSMVCLASAMIQGSHGTYYAFSTLHWRDAGLSERTIGFLWAEGVVAEIVLFAVATRLLRATGARGLILLGAIAAVVRWLLTAETTALLPLAGLQVLHAFSFGATHFACVQWIATRVPGRRSATAQSVFGAVTGLGVAAGTAVAGPLFAQDPGFAFQWMAAPAALGAAFAIASRIGRD